MNSYILAVAKALPILSYPILLLSDLYPRQLAPTVGQASKRLPASLRFHLFVMSSGGDLCMGHEILFSALSFITDDSAWLRDAPLDVEALPSRGATHFRASSCGLLLLQPSAPVSIFAPVTRHNKRSRRPRT